MADEIEKGTDQDRGREDRVEPNEPGDEQGKDMMAMVEGVFKNKETEKEPEKKEEEPKSEPTKESEPKSKDEKETKKDGDSESDKEEEVDSGELDTLKSQVEAQAKIIESMATLGIQVPTTTKEDKAEVEQTAKSVLQAPKPPTEDKIDFIGDGDILELFSDKTKINELLTKVYNMGQTRTYENLPKIIQDRVDYTDNLRETSRKFFDKHKDLGETEGRRTLVGVVAKTLEMQHPDWSPEKVMEVLPDEVRKLLNIKEIAEKTKKKDKSKGSGLPTKTSGSREPIEKDKVLTFDQEQQADMSKMIKASESL